MVKRKLMVADLFSGCGGTTTGLQEALDELNMRADVMAVNHWPLAVESHAANHPRYGHHCGDVTRISPKTLIPGRRLDLLVASPECVFHSIARGGKPINDQRRASAWCVQEWATELKVDRIVIENVPEFVNWGPVTKRGKIIKSQRGTIFKAYVNALISLGYQVEWRILNSADYGGATARKRLFIQATRSRRPIRWPAPTHSETGANGLPMWRGAWEIINWGLLGTPIFSRSRPLVANTLRRIAAGIKIFGGENAQPFLTMLNGGGRQGAGGVKSVHDPLPTIVAGGTHHGLVQPFLMTQNYMGDAKQDHRSTKSPSEPLPTVTTQSNRFGLVRPFLLPQNSSNRPRSVDEPVPTLTTTSRGVGVVEPYITAFYGNTTAPDSVQEPLSTITTKGRHGLVEPFIYTIDHGGKDGGRTRSAKAPLSVITTKVRHAVVEPFIRAGEPAPSYAHDILFRMLQPVELAAAMGLPPGYKILGTKEDQVKQIGNMVEVNTAKQLLLSVIHPE